MAWKVPDQASASVMMPAIRAGDDQMRDAMRQRVGLAGTRAGDDQERRDVVEGRTAVLDGPALFGIERREV